MDWSQFEKLLQVERIVLWDVAVPELDESFRENVSTTLKFFMMKRTSTSRLDDKVSGLLFRLNAKLSNKKRSES